MNNRYEVYSFYSKKISREFKKFLKENNIKITKVQEYPQNYVYEVCASERDIAIISIYIKWLYTLREKSFKEFFKDHTAFYYKEVPTVKTWVTLRPNRMTNAKDGYIYTSRNTVYFPGLYKGWERSYELKYYESSKGYYINFHGRRLYFDIRERTENELVAVRVIRGVEV